MSTQPTSPDLTLQPDPHQDSAAGTATPPSRTAHLLILVRKLIDHGFKLAATLRQRSSANDLRAMTRPFGTADLKLIFARIAHGLRLAGALEERLMRHPVPEEKKPASTGASSTSARPQRQPRAARPTVRWSDGPDIDLASLPTPEQIAAEVRRRPVGAVIADICRDLGILFGHELWHDLSLAIMDHGGSLVRLSKDIFKRLRRSRAPLSAGTDPAWPASHSPLAQACGTGPPGAG